MMEKIIHSESSPTIVHAEQKALQVSAKTRWIFLKVTCSDGHVGHGEATMEGHDAQVEAALVRLIDVISGAPASPDDCNPLGLLTIVGRSSYDYTALSALDQALCDAQGKRQNCSVATLLAETPQPVKLYANINRGTIDRSPKGFAQAARKALAAGYTMVKIAPFDGLDWKSGRDINSAELYADGIDRIAAVRDELGKDINLAVDCHWRFDLDSASQLINDLRPMDLYWIECPLPEPVNAVEDLRNLRSQCAAAGTQLAGLENANGLAGVQPFLTGGAYDVIMPDVKYSGGISECIRISRAASINDVLCSPHNPTGPICHAASLHLASALENCPVLEHQFGETPLFDELAEHKFPALVEGYSNLPSGAGFGVPLLLSPP